MPYPMQKQKMGLWCWAAVSLSVDRYFNSSSTESQCKIANKVKNIQCCPEVEACNEAAELQTALNKVHRFDLMIDGPLSFDSLREFINAGYPVCVRIGWRPHGGHFVVITGYAISDEGEPFVTVADPRYESGSWPYEEFASAYFGIGHWTHTYLVKR